MCVILQLPKDITPSFEKVKNAVLNNPDGYGILMVDRGKLEVRKEVPVKGNDPDEIYQYIVDTIGVDRYLHVRKNTVGKTIVENAHPFNVFKLDSGREVWFMHNGTLSKWRPSSTMSEDSDTKNYAENFLHPLLYRFVGDNHGLGDYTDPFFKTLIADHFDYSNRGLLIANDLPILELGQWKEIKENGITYRASNDDYFNSVMTHRMSEAQRSSWNAPRFQDSKPDGIHPLTGNPERVTNANAPQQKATPASKEEREASQVLVPLKDIDLEKRNGRRLRSEEVNSLMAVGISEIEELDNEQLSYFVYLTKKEINSWVASNIEAASLFLELMFTKYAEMCEEYEALDTQRMTIVNKHERATTVIAEQVQKINNLEAEIAELKKALNAKTGRVTKKATEEKVAA